MYKQEGRAIAMNAVRSRGLPKRSRGDRHRLQRRVEVGMIDPRGIREICEPTLAEWNDGVHPITAMRELGGR
jgi:hypothetical protein